MIRQPISKHWYIILGVLSAVLLLAGYTWLSYRQHVKNPDDTTIPTWTQLKDGGVKAFSPGRRDERWIVVDSIATVKRFILGMLIGVAGAITLGILMGCFGRVEAFFAPPLGLLAKIPPTAALAVFFVMVGTNTEMYVAMIAFGVLPSLAQSVFLGVRDVQDEQIYKAYTLGAKPVEVIWNVIVPTILPRLIDAVRLQIGPALVYLIAAEMVVGHEGFGYRIRLQSKLLDMSVVYIYLAILALFGFALDFGLRKLQGFWCPWYVKEGT